MGLSERNEGADGGLEQNAKMPNRSFCSISLFRIGFFRKPAPIFRPDALEARLGRGAWIAVAVLSVIAVFPSLPGRMNADALDMFGQAMRGSYRDWHIPLVSWFWGVLGASPTMIAIETVLVAFAMLASFAILFRRAGLGDRGAVVAAALLGFFPPIYSYLAAVAKDTWAAAILLLLLVLSVIRQRDWSVGLRAALVALAIVIRPEMLLLVPLFLAAEYFLFGRRGRQPLLFAGFLAVLLVAHNQFIYRVLPTERTNPESVIFLFDLAGMSMRSGEMLLTPAAFPPQDMAVLEKHYVRDHIAPLLWAKPKEEMLVQVRGDDLRDLRSRWIGSIMAHPGDYIAVRLGVIRSYFRGHWRYHPGIDKNPVIGLNFEGLNGAVNAVLDRVPRFLFSHWLPLWGNFLLVGTLLWLGEQRRRPAIFSYAGIGLAYQLILLPLIVAPEFRFGYGGVVLFYLITVLTVAAHRDALLSGFAGLRRRRQRHSRDAGNRRPEN